MHAFVLIPIISPQPKILPYLRQYITSYMTLNARPNTIPSQWQYSSPPNRKEGHKRNNNASSSKIPADSQNLAPASNNPNPAYMPAAA